MESAYRSVVLCYLGIEARNRLEAAARAAVRAMDNLARRTGKEACRRGVALAPGCERGGKSRRSIGASLGRPCGKMRLLHGAKRCQVIRQRRRALQAQRLLLRLAPPADHMYATHEAEAFIQRAGHVAGVPASTARAICSRSRALDIMQLFDMQGPG